jgi:hypothetical protein
MNNITIQTPEGVIVTDKNLEQVQFSLVFPAPYTDRMGTTFPAQDFESISIADQKKKIASIDYAISEHRKNIESYTKNENTAIENLLKDKTAVTQKMTELTTYANSVKVSDPVINPEVTPE